MYIYAHFTLTLTSKYSIKSQSYQESYLPLPIFIIKFETVKMAELKLSISSGSKLIKSFLQQASNLLQSVNLCAYNFTGKNCKPISVPNTMNYFCTQSKQRVSDLRPAIVDCRISKRTHTTLKCPARSLGRT